MIIASIDVGLLFELAWAAALAGVVVSLCFSLVILGSARAGELRREGRAAAATAYATLAVLGAAAVTALIVFGISVVVSK
jgi:hypothetical protein